MLDPEELNHYRRHLSLPEFGPSGQERLKAGSVLVVGAGGLGCPALQYLAAAGVGRIGICDFDVVESSNLQRQVLFGYSDLGKPKAECAARRLADLNPHIEITPFVERFSPDNAEALLNDFDVVLDGSDNFPTRYLVNDACVKFGKPLSFGSIFKFEGQVSVFNYKGGPTYRCLFPKSPNPKDVPNCAEIGVIGVLPGIVGGLQALEVIKILSGVGEVFSGKLLLFDALTLRVNQVGFSANPENFDVTELKEIEFACETEVVEEEEIPQLMPRELDELLKEDDSPLLLDVREDWELAVCRIDGSVSLPLSSLKQPKPIELPSELSPGTDTVVYCKAGVRSMMVCEILRDVYGFDKVSNLAGGIDLWAETVDPAMPRY